MKPILFNTEMVKAILDGYKAQTRRIVQEKYQALLIEFFNRDSIDKDALHNFIIIHAKYKVGDVLYIRETFNDEGDDGVLYKADVINDMDFKSYWWKPSIHMPKRYARTFLEVTNVRVERLQNISNEDILAEGINIKSIHSAFQEEDNRNCWIWIWNKTAQKGYKWEDNPYVFVCEFEKK